MDDMNNLLNVIFKKLSLTIIISLISINVVSETFQLGDLAPRGNPDGQLDAADILLLERIVFGDIVPTYNEERIGNVAPLGTPDNELNTGDLVVQQRATLGLITLGTIDITPLPAPTIIVRGPGGVITATENPYLINGKASPGASVDIYVNNKLQHQSIANLSKGEFSKEVYLDDGINDIYAIENDGVNISPSSNVIQVQYDNVIDKNNVPSIISVDTVWTSGGNSDPYIINSELVISNGVTLVLQPGVSVVFEDDLSNIEVTGTLVINGDEDNKVLLTESAQTPGQGWNGVWVKNGGNVIIDHAIIEYANNYSFFDANSGVFFATGSSGNIKNTLIQFCRAGIELEGNTSPTIGPNNTITQNNTGVYLTDGDRGYDRGANPTPVIYSNKILNNIDSNLFVVSVYNKDSGGFPVDARGNYWGAIVLGDIADKMPSTDYVDFSDYLDADGNVVIVENLLQGLISSNTTLSEDSTYDVLGILEISSGATLTIPKGTTLRFAKYSGLTVSGNLNVLGTQLDPVFLTSGKSVPTKNSWQSIDIKDGGNVNIDYAYIEYGSVLIWFRSGSSGSVSNSIVRESSEDGIRIDGVSPSILNNTITQNGINQGVGINITGGDANTVPVIKNNKIFDNRLPILIGSFIDGHNILLDMRENYWGTVDVTEMTVYGCGGVHNLKAP